MGDAPCPVQAVRPGRRTNDSPGGASAFPAPRITTLTPNSDIGQPVRRTEDASLLSGKGRYTDDFNEPGQAYAAIVRSPHAHGVLKGIDSEAAKRMPGVLAIYTAAELTAYGPHKCALDFKQRDGTPRMSASWFRIAYTPWPCAISVQRSPSYLQTAERGSIAATTTRVLRRLSRVTCAALAKAAATFSGSP